VPLLTKVLSLARHVGPRLLEATFGPAACFLTGRALWGLNGALALALAWTGGCMGLRAVRGQRSNGLLMIGAATLVLRVAVSFALRSESAYLLAPALVTAALGALYVASALVGTPLLARFAGDLLPASWVESGDAPLLRLCRIGSVVWGVEQIVSAAISLVMISNLSVPTYLMVHEIVSWATFGVVIGAVLPFFWKDFRALKNARTLALGH
jgi:hypothetical protein